MKIKLKNKKAMSLAEVLVAIGIFSLIMVGSAMLFAKSWRYQKTILETETASLSSSQTITGMIDIIRRARSADNGAYALKTAGDFEVTVYSDFDKDGVTEKVHFYLNNGNLYKGYSEPSGFPLTYPSDDQNTKVLAENILNNSEQPVFSYFDKYNNQVENTVDNFSDIRMVKIYLIFPKGNGEILEVENYASIRNLSDYDHS